MLFDWHSFSERDCSDASGCVKDPHAERKVINQRVEVIGPNHQRCYNFVSLQKFYTLAKNVTNDAIEHDSGNGSHTLHVDH